MRHRCAGATLHVLPLLLMAVLAAAVLGACGCGRNVATEAEPVPAPAAPEAPPSELTGRLIIFHAASLARPFEAIEKAMEEQHPRLDVVRESSNSHVACRKVTELSRIADIVATADYTLLRHMLVPEAADWFVAFARNRIGIAYTDRSRYRTEISQDNWFDILLRDDVGYGYSDPNQAPVGYATLLTWKLADIYYADVKGDRSLFDELKAGCPESNIRPHCNELIPLLQSMGLDYIFEYQSVSRQHNLQFLQLPAEIDLSSEKHAEYYAQASVTISGKKRGEQVTKVGSPVVYGITIVKDAPNPQAATAFIAFLLGEDGRAIMEENFQEAISPALTPDAAALPRELSEFVQQSEM
jgi:molybdate/tungstate transport system substrate-binding protein